MIDQLVRQQIKNMQEINWGEIPDDNPYRLLWGENQLAIAIYKDMLKRFNPQDEEVLKSLKEWGARVE